MTWTEVLMMRAAPYNIFQSSVQFSHRRTTKGLGKSHKALAILFVLLCAHGVHLSVATGSSSSESSSAPQPPPPSPPANSDSRSSSGGSGESFSSSANNNFDTFEVTDNNNDFYSNNLDGGNSAETSSPPQPQSPLKPSSSSLSTPSVRAVSTRPSSDISTSSSIDGDPSVSSHYDVCPHADPWCSKLDENEKLALEAIHALHHQLDDDKNGNIDLYESNEFLREELKYDRDYEKRQENFHRNNDNQVSVKELWETWVRSEVHNWTVDQTGEWIGTFVGLPHYQEKFIQLEINGTFLPRLAVNHHNFLTTNLGIKDVITRQKLTLKAQDVVLFGPPRDNTNRTKDIILTTLLVVAVTVCYLVYCRYKSSQRDLSRMSKDMEALMKAEENLRDLQKELEQAKCDQEIRDREAVTHRSSSDDEDELIKLRDEVIVLRNELQRAEVELQDKCWVPPPALTHWLQLTYELESKAHSKKRQSAEKQLKQAKEACDKLKKKRSSLMGAFVATHARSIDDVDKAILEARAALTEVTQELQERMHRWKQIEMLVKSPIVNNPGLASLEILLRSGSRINPYLGTGSVMSNSQDDIDDDGASSIYCPSAVHKLISTSAFMMFPGQTPQTARSYHQHQQHAANTSSSDYSSLTNYGSGDSCRQSQSPDLSRREHHHHHHHQQQQQQQPPQHQQQPHRTNHTVSSSCHLCQHNDCSCFNTTGDFLESNEVSGPITNIHTPIVRSKSVQSMLSLRDHPQQPPQRAGFSNYRESSSKDSSNGEEDLIAGEASEMTAKDRRVTFRAAGERRSGQLRSFQGRGTTGPPLYEPMEFEENRNFCTTRTRSLGTAPAISRMEGSHNPKSSEEESNQSRGKKQLEEEPDLIPCQHYQQQQHHHPPHHNHHYHHQSSNTSNNNSSSNNNNNNNNNVIEEERVPTTDEEDVNPGFSEPSQRHHHHHHRSSPAGRKTSLPIPAAPVVDFPKGSYLQLPGMTSRKTSLLSTDGSDQKSVLTLPLGSATLPATLVPPSPKISFLKKISKLMRFGHNDHHNHNHGLNGKKTLKRSFTEQQQNSHNQTQNQQQQQHHHHYPPSQQPQSTERLINGVNPGGGEGGGGGGVGGEDEDDSSNTLPASISRHCDSGEDNSANELGKPTTRAKAQKRPIKFFSSLRNRHSNKSLVAESSSQPSNKTPGTVDNTSKSQQ